MDIGCPGSWPTWGSIPAPFWYQVLDPYMKNAQIWVCPSDQVPHKACTGNAPKYFASYAKNVWISATADAKVQSPATTIYATDGTNNYYYYFNDGSKGWPVPTRHNDGWNVLYYEGHVKWHRQVKPDAGYHWANGFPTPNTGGF